MPLRSTIHPMGTRFASVTREANLNDTIPTGGSAGHVDTFRRGPSSLGAWASFSGSRVPTRAVVYPEIATGLSRIGSAQSSDAPNRSAKAALVRLRQIATMSDTQVKKMAAMLITTRSGELDVTKLTREQAEFVVKMQWFGAHDMVMQPGYFDTVDTPDEMEGILVGVIRDMHDIRHDIRPDASAHELLNGIALIQSTGGREVTNFDDWRDLAEAQASGNLLDFIKGKQEGDLGVGGDPSPGHDHSTSEQPTSHDGTVDESSPFPEHDDGLGTSPLSGHGNDGAGTGSSGAVLGGEGPSTGDSGTGGGNAAGDDGLGGTTILEEPSEDEITISFRDESESGFGTLTVSQNDDGSVSITGIVYDSQGNRRWVDNENYTNPSGDGVTWVGDKGGSIHGPKPENGTHDVIVADNGTIGFDATDNDDEKATDENSESSTSSTDSMPNPLGDDNLGFESVRLQPVLSGPITEDTAVSSEALGLDTGRIRRTRNDGAIRPNPLGENGQGAGRLGTPVLWGDGLDPDLGVGRGQSVGGPTGPGHNLGGDDQADD